MLIPVDGSEHLPEDVRQLQDTMKSPAERWAAQERQHLIDQIGEHAADEWISVLQDNSPDGRNVSIWDAIRFALDIRRQYKD